ncbi:MAG: pilin [Candidatus Magasanikbacteria bacterium]|jgi:hypothetical protein
MQIFNKIFFGLVCLILFFSVSTKVSAAGGSCLCATNLDAPEASDAIIYKDFKLGAKSLVLKAQCVDAPAAKCNKESQVEIVKNKIAPECNIKSSTSDCNTLMQEWSVNYQSKVNAGKATVNPPAQTAPKSQSTLSEWITKCGKGGKIETWEPECKDITIFVSLLLTIVSYLFGIIGALALGAFVYGGFVLILSQGNPEKVKQGTGVMINAVIGLLVAFGGYVLISYLGEILELRKEFRLL